MITDSAGITGPSQAYAIIGSPSPTTPGNLQVVTTQQASWTNTVGAALKNVFNTFSFGATNDAVAKTAQVISASAENTGKAISSVATSASSGIRIGFILLIVLGGIILFAQVRRATG